MSDVGPFGYGQQDPSDSAAELNVVAFIVRQMMAQMSTMKLVQVQAVHGNGSVAAAGTVDVLPLVSQLDGNGNSVPMGTVYGIPWFRLQGGKNAIIADPVAGDIGYVIIADRDISNVKANRKPSVPGSFRKFDIADGLYVGGALNDAPEQYILFTDDGLKIVDKSGDIVEFLSGGGITITLATAKPLTVIGNVIIRGNLQLEGVLQAVDGSIYTGAIATTGDITAGTISLKGHHHTQPPDSHGDTEQPTSAPTP